MANRRVPGWVFIAAIAAVLGIVLGVGAAVMSGGGGETPPADDGRLRVVASIPPVAGLVQPLLPEGTEFVTLVPSGRSVHGFSLSPSDLARLAGADVVVSIGLGLETGLDRALDRAAPDARRVVFAHVVGLDDTEAEHGHAHEHGHDHDDGAVDEHLWLDPALCIELVNAVEEALAAQPGVDTAALATRADALRAHINDIDRQYREALAPYHGARIITLHRAYGRIANRYGLEIASVVRPLNTSEPTPAQVEASARAIEEGGVRAIFIEPQLPSAIAVRLAERAGVGLRTLDPLGRGDWFAMMESNLHELVAGLEGERTDTVDDADE